MARFGFINVGIENGSVSTITPIDIALTLVGPSGTAISLRELQGLTLDAQVSGSVSVVLPLTAEGFSIPASTQTQFTVLFPDLSSPDNFSVTLPSMPELARFTNISAAGVVSLLAELTSFLDQMRDGQLGSIEIPFVEPGLDAILDLAEIFSDAILYDDGGDNAVDGDSKLLTDVNRALSRSGLEGQIRAQANGTNITLVAIDPTIDDFTITFDPDDAGGLSQLGFSNGPQSAGAFPTIVGGAAALNGVINSLAAFSISVTRGTTSFVRSVRVEPSETSDNTGIGDDIAKLVDENNAPTFATAQEMAVRLAALLANFGEDSIEYDALTSRLTYDLAFEDVELFNVEAPIDFELDLSPVVNIQSDTRLIISASGGFSLRFGIDLSDNPPGGDPLNLSDTLESLDVTVKHEEAITADNLPRTILDDFAGDATFAVRLNGGSPISVVLPQEVRQCERNDR